MKRHTITLGASTSAGGKVITASSNGSINGVTIALEGDVIFCPACKSQGKIMCVGPRIPET
ncbi:putative Zn-binding protein involved in type VI secretion [Duganella sp. 1411]|uniref:PAAR domain-containing protein n=1 Tax=Duganella sp. 1411 TaxID=2806572 RepID=UPI001AE76BD1|nr:PAAR domain-containing protein [Duganella sp. 1411]MBP1206187.1 putative Zn-binding protein involved in type VI secretion [Duganella sp. 1411]